MPIKFFPEIARNIPEYVRATVRIVQDFHMHAIISTCLFTEPFRLQDFPVPHRSLAALTYATTHQDCQVVMSMKSHIDRKKAKYKINAQRQF